MGQFFYDIQMVLVNDTPQWLLALLLMLAAVLCGVVSVGIICLSVITFGGEITLVGGFVLFVFAVFYCMAGALQR